MTTEAKIDNSRKELELYFMSLNNHWSSLEMWDGSVASTEYFGRREIKGLSSEEKYMFHGVLQDNYLCEKSGIF